MESNPLPPAPEGQTDETTERKLKESPSLWRAALSVLALVVAGALLWSFLTVDTVPAKLTAPTVSVAPERPAPMSQKVLQMKADQLFQIATTRPADDFWKALGQLKLAYSPTECQFGVDFGLVKNRKQVVGALRAGKQGLEDTPDGLGDPQFATASGPFQKQQAWFVLAMACPEDA